MTGRHVDLVRSRMVFIGVLVALVVVVAIVVHEKCSGEINRLTAHAARSTLQARRHEIQQGVRLWPNRQWT